MNVNIFTDSANHPRFKEMLSAFAEGIKQSGDSVQMREGLCTPLDIDDVAVIFGSWKKRRDLHHVVKQTVTQWVKNYIVIETPLVGRGPVADVMQDDWYRVGLNGFLADTGNFNNNNRDATRWEKVQKELGVEMKPWNNAGSHILLALQLPGDASLRGADISQWAYDTCRKIRTYTDRSIVIRTPQIPRQYNTELFNKMNSEIKELYWQEGTKENLNEALDEAWCTVTYSSGLGIDSVLRGTPAFALDTGSFVHCLGNNNLSNIENPSLPSREQWINDLCYAQWNVDEMKKGEAWNHIKEAL